MPVEPDHYATLGVSPASEDVVIRAAFKALMLKYHPDTNRSLEATNQAKAINAAFSVLGDSTKRAAYDAVRRPRPTSSRASTPPSPPPPPAPPPSSPNNASKPPSPPHPSTKPVDKSEKKSLFATAGGVLVVALVGGLVRLIAQSPNGSQPNTPAYPTNGLARTSTMSNDMMVADIPPSSGMMANMAGPLTATPTVPALDAGLGSPPAVSYTEVESAADLFAHVLGSSGMAGARSWSEDCHRKAAKAPTWARADRCAAFDLAAHYLDLGVSKASGSIPIGYFAFEATNQADEYSRLGVSPFALGDRVARIQQAVEPATNDAVSAMIARRQQKRSDNLKSIENAIGEGNQIAIPGN